MEQLRKLQLVQLYILKKVKKVCEENGLKYYLIGGTLLGAIRHQGFIPWDDDVDIVMYRNDLRKLENIFRTQYSTEFFVQNFYSDPEYTRYITKIRLNGTIQEEKTYTGMDMHKGIYIDIFPLDYVKKNQGIEMYLRGKLLRCLFAAKTIKHVKSKNKRKWKQIFIQACKPIFWFIPDYVINILFDWVCGKDNKKSCKFTANFASHFGWKKQTYPNEVYGDGTKALFEGEWFSIPSQPEVILKSIYGDNYMQPPPIDKRNSGHTLDKIDLGKYENIFLGQETKESK